MTSDPWPPNSLPDGQAAGPYHHPFVQAENPFPLVSVIIVTYNGKHYLDDCLESLQRQSYPPQLMDLVLVDNGSTDGTIDFVRQKFPSIRVVSLARNLGFAGGNNRGIESARGEYICLLNNDTVVAPNWLEALVHALLLYPRAGAVSSKVLFKIRPELINSTGLTLYRDGRGGDRGFRQEDKGQYDNAIEVFGGCGASTLIRRKMLEDVGLFDERLFMYYEDLDLAWRARLMGWKFYFAPQSVVYHVHCGTSGEWSPFFLFHVERNRVFVSLKNGPALLALRSLAVFAARAIRKWALVITLQERGTLHRQQAIAYIKSAISLLRGIPLMLRQRQQIRHRLRRVEDEEIIRLMEPAPPRARLAA